jgi:hypothetical protein
MKRYLARFLAVLLLATGITAAASAPAQAAVNNCGVAICVWDPTNFSGSPMYYWTINSIPNGGCINFGSAINDRMRAGRNNVTWIATFYTGANCSGSVVVTLSQFSSAGQYRNCANTIYDKSTGYWNSFASGCNAFPNDRHISSVWTVH